MGRLARLIGSSGVVALVVGVGVAVSAPGSPGKPEAEAVGRHWTPERRAQAIPRDLVVDHRGLGYLQTPIGRLVPYGHSTPARARPVRVVSPKPTGKPGGGGGGGGSGGSSDTAPPSISGMDPGVGSMIGSERTFSATVTDPSGVRSVSFVLIYPDGRTQTDPATKGSGDVWSISYSGFTTGDGWAWKVVAKDATRKSGNTGESELVDFSVDTGTGGSGGGSGSTGGSTVTNAAWTGGGPVQTAAGRIFFEMPSNAAQTLWAAYVCSGTAVTDQATGVSVILTAAHCVYDDLDGAFARNVLFIPDQDGTTGAGSDRDCTNDPLGCWVPSHGVVDADWTTRTWPDNIPWDYGYYVVPTSGAHVGAAAPSDSLEQAAGTLSVSFTAPDTGSGAYTHGLGYSYSEDPNFMYCAEDLGTQGSSNWWLSQCGLTGGASGGPWVQPLSGGTGPIVSVNSWRYSGLPGMAGPKLSGTSAQCLFGAAQNASLTPTNRGVIPIGC